MARIVRLDILWSVNKLARSVTKWTQACDRRLARLISYIHHTNDFRQYCHVGNTAQQCRLGLFQDSDFAGDLEESKSTSGGLLRIFGSQRFVPISWMWKKQTSVSHSQQKLRLFPLMQVYAWMEFPLLIFGTQWLKYFIPHQTRLSKSQRSCRVRGKPVAEHNAQHAKPVSNQAHQSRSDYG